MAYKKSKNIIKNPSIHFYLLIQVWVAGATASAEFIYDGTVEFNFCLCNML